MVKARPKWDRMNGTVVKDQPLEVFGRWQTEIYIPPPAVDGKVPRNEYGNVELFKPWMLPKGTIHLPIAGIYSVYGHQIEFQLIECHVPLLHTKQLTNHAALTDKLYQVHKYALMEVENPLLAPGSEPISIQLAHSFQGSRSSISAPIGTHYSGRPCRGHENHHCSHQQHQSRLVHLIVQLSNCFIYSPELPGPPGYLQYYVI